MSFRVQDYNKEIPKVTFAAAIGTTIDYYDYFIALLVASIAWPTVFFPSVSADVGLALSISSAAVTLLFRPIGAFIFGHLGDRLGRKKMLMWTLSTMGISTLGIALVPSYAAIGIAAPIIVIFFRILFGIGAGGEYGGAIAWTSEFVSKSKNRAFWTSWVQIATAIGLVISSAVVFFLFIAASSSGKVAFINNGWRIPFFFGAVLIVIGVAIRYFLGESPLFKKLGSKKVDKTPALTIIKSNWRLILTLAIAPEFAASVISLEVVPFSETYISHIILNGDIAFATVSVILGGIFAIFTAICGALISDKIGRKKTLYLSALLTMVFTYPYFMLINTGSYALIILAQLLLIGSIFIAAGVIPILLAEQFVTKYRYSGIGLSNQSGGVLAGVLTTFVLPAIIISSGTLTAAWPKIVFVSIGICILSIIFISFIKETKDKKMV
jgi:MFS family permease